MEKSQAKDIGGFPKVDSFLERIRKLLVGSSQQDKVLTSMQELRVIDYDEIKDK